MKIYDIETDVEGADTFLKVTDLDNFFEVYQDKKDNYVYNLNSSIYFNFQDANNLPVFTCTHDMHWPLISYHLYDTTRLAWLLLKVNDVHPKDVFKIKHAGDKIKYIAKDHAEEIVRTINGYS